MYVKSGIVYMVGEGKEGGREGEGKGEERGKGELRKEGREGKVMSPNVTLNTPFP